MMPDVTRHDERQGAHRRRAAVCRTGPAPGGLVEAAQHDEIGFPQPGEFVDQIREAAAIEAGMRDVLLFIEAREVGVLTAADAERPVSEHPLGVANVAEYLPDAPLPGGVAERFPRRREHLRSAANLRR